MSKCPISTKNLKGSRIQFIKKTNGAVNYLHAVAFPDVKNVIINVS